ncbi:hypothetical protein RhiirA4_457816 [Rhizophagus irregularis]|uniref:Uncharacterized protein n=1 Tax=Rhizophagus irregularis TaxID=588596 RepID=A0A2I1GAT5_9GLOM|nr:hypothetical protein RhiirA4_457816 [Rhizophagus irregularis]
MSAKFNTICYIYNIAEYLIQDFTIEEIIGIMRIKDNNLTKVIYLKIKAFILSNQNIESKIIDFENKQIIMPLPILNFNDMASISLNIIPVRLITKTVMNINSYLVLNFYVEENLGNYEPNEFWVETKYNSNNRYLANKMNSIN